MSFIRWVLAELSSEYKLSFELSDGTSNRNPEHRDEFGVYVHYHGKMIASAYFRHRGDHLEPMDDDGKPSVNVASEHRRKGVASAMYEYAESISDVKVIPSQGRTDEGKAFWKQPNRKFGKII